MKKYFLLFIFLIGLQVRLMAQKKEERKLEPFTVIKVGQAISLELKKGTTNMALVESENVALNEVILETSGNELNIRLKKSSYNNPKVKVILTYISLEEIMCHSAASVTSKETLKGGNMDFEVSSSGQVSLTLAVNTLEAEVSSAGKLELTGKANEQEIEVSSAGKFEGENLKGSRVKVNASSAGKATVFAVKSLEADASSGGNIRYLGAPAQKDVKTSSGGSVKSID